MVGRRACVGKAVADGVMPGMEVTAPPDTGVGVAYLGVGVGDDDGNPVGMFEVGGTGRVSVGAPPVGGVTGANGVSVLGNGVRDGAGVPPEVGVACPSPGPG